MPGRVPSSVIMSRRREQEARLSQHIRGVRLADNESCPECGMPAYISDEFLWLDSGVIVRRKDPGHRMV